MITLPTIDQGALDLVTGVLAFLAACALAWRRLMLRPDHPGWADAPRAVRAVLVLMVFIMGFTGVVILGDGVHADWLLALVCGGTAVMASTMAWNLYRTGRVVASGPLVRHAGGGNGALAAGAAVAARGGGEGRSFVEGRGGPGATP